jgi:hypothetical protein
LNFGLARDHSRKDAKYGKLEQTRKYFALRTWRLGAKKISASSTPAYAIAIE